MMHLLPAFALFIAPIVFFGYFKLRQVRQATDAAERSAEPFAPAAAAAASNGLMKRFDLPEQTYLRQQLKLAASLYGLLSWTCFFVLRMPIFQPGAAHAKRSGGAALAWFMFLSNAGKTVAFLGVMWVLCAFIAVAPLRTGADGRFYRTRAVSIGFLYWSRLLPTMAALMLAVVTGVGLACALLLAVRGPVWQNLPPRFPRAGPEDGDVAAMYLKLLNTSARGYFYQCSRALFWRLRRLSRCSAFRFQQEILRSLLDAGF